MNRHLIVNVLTIGVTLMAMAAGCQQRKPPQVNSGPASEDQVARIRESFQSQNPKTRVGVIVDLLPGQQLAAVGSVNTHDFYVGETVCFIDANSNPIVCGRVLRITEDQVHVRYETPAVGHRAPVPGDIAVAFGDSAASQPMASSIVGSSIVPATQP